MRILPRLILLLCVVLTAKAMAAEPSEPSSPGQRLFVSSFMTMHDPFFVELSKGIEKAVVSHGDRILFLDGQHSRQKQEADLIEALKGKPSAIFLIPATDLGASDGILKAAAAQKVPVVLVDTDLGAPANALCQVLTDNLQAGRLSCDALAAANPNARVGVLGFSLSKTCVDRVEGFKDEMKKYPAMKLLAIQDGHANRDGVRGVIREFLGAHPDMDAIFAINDVSALEACSGIEAAGRSGKIWVLGVAGSKEGVEAVSSGRMLSTCAQEPSEMGRIAVEKAYDFLAGRSVEKDVRVPVTLITRANSKDFDKRP